MAHTVGIFKRLIRQIFAVVFACLVRACHSSLKVRRPPAGQGTNPIALGRTSPITRGLVSNGAFHTGGRPFRRLRARVAVEQINTHASLLPALKRAAVGSGPRYTKSKFPRAGSRRVFSGRSRFSHVVRSIGKEKGVAEYPIWLIDYLDRFAEIRIDDKTEDEYWIVSLAPFLDSIRFLRKDTSVAEIATGGFAAGIVVEFLVAFLSYPFDTVKTRLQANPRQALKKYPTLDQIYDGFGPVALTVPALSVFWATKDVVRTSIIGAVKENVPWLVLDTFATSLGSILGEAIYWVIKAPSEVLKTQLQTAAMQAEELQQMDLLGIGKNRSKVIMRDVDSSKQFQEVLQQVIQIWPVLAISDVAYVGLRVGLFVALHDSGLVPSGISEDALLYLFANVVAVLLTTPLDVVRTQMLLRGSRISDLPTVVKELYGKDGLLSFVAGWSPRLVYNGIIIGIAWGFVRQLYPELRDKFLVDVLDRIEGNRR